MTLLILGVLLCTVLLWFFASPNSFSKQHILQRATVAILVTIFIALGFYFLFPTLTPFFMGIYFGLNLALALFVNGRLSRKEGIELTGAVIFFVIFIGIFIAPTLLGIVTATTLANTPHVTEVNAPSDIINVSHIRLVSIETAAWRADKVIGSLGFKSEVGHPNIQLQNGTLVWLVPLDYTAIIPAWNYRNEGTGGYVVVSAEDPKGDAQLVTVDHFVYTPGATFGNNLNRIVWMAYPDRIQTETTFQLDDRYRPEYVVQLAEPLLYGTLGEKPVGMVVINPAIGNLTYYRIGEQPAWIQRVWSESVTEEWIGLWGKYQGGWINSWWTQRDLRKLTGGVEIEESSSGSTRVTEGSPDVFLVNGNDGNLYWFGSMTTMGKDTSMVGYMLVNLRTGNFTYHKANGYYNDIGAANNVQQHQLVAMAPGLRVVQPIMYVIDGQEVWIIPVITQNGELTEIGLVEAKSGKTYVGTSLQEVLNQWRGSVAGQVLTDSDSRNMTIRQKLEQVHQFLNEIEMEIREDGNTTVMG